MGKSEIRREKRETGTSSLRASAVRGGVHPPSKWMKIKTNGLQSASCKRLKVKGIDDRKIGVH